MAGDWIPMRVDLPDDPAVIAIAAATGLDEDTVTGKLLRLWSWANKHLTDGSASVTEVWLDRHISAPGFAAAMLANGWLLRTENGVVFPHFDRWNSKGAKVRLSETQRKKEFRERKPRKSCPKNVPEVVPDLSQTCPKIVPPNPGPEKRREEKSKDSSSPRTAEGKSPRKPRAPDPLFDAIAEVTLTDPDASGSFVGKVTAELRRADPPYTPDEIREFGRRFTELCSWAAKDGRKHPELGELHKNIGKVRFRLKPAAPDSGPKFNPMEGHDMMDFDAIRRGA